MGDYGISQCRLPKDAAPAADVTCLFTQAGITFLFQGPLLRNRSFYHPWVTYMATSSETEIYIEDPRVRIDQLLKTPTAINSQLEAFLW